MHFNKVKNDFCVRLRSEKEPKTKMADEDLSLNEDQLLDNLDDANGDGDLLISEVCFIVADRRIIA